MVHPEGLSNSEGERTEGISPVEGMGQRWKGRNVIIPVARKGSRYFFFFFLTGWKQQKAFNFLCKNIVADAPCYLLSSLFHLARGQTCSVKEGRSLVLGRIGFYFGPKGESWDSRPVCHSGFGQKNPVLGPLHNNTIAVIVTNILSLISVVNLFQS